MTILFRNINPTKDAALTNLWRSDKRVQNNTRTFVNHSNQKQKEYLIRMNNSTDFLHWIVANNNIDFAYCMALDYDPKLLRISWGYWIGNDSFFGMGALVSSIFYNFFFFNTKIKSIRAEVLSHNKSVLSMHQSMGYKLLETIQIGTHKKKKAYEHILILEKKAWLSQPKSLIKLRGKFDFLSSEENLLNKLKLNGAKGL